MKETDGVRKVLSTKKQAVICIIGFLVVIVLVVAGILVLHSKTLYTKGYEIGEGIYIGMAKEDVLEILNTEFTNVRLSSTNEYSIDINNPRGRDFFKVDGFSLITFSFRDEKLCRVMLSGQGKYTSWSEICSGLGFENLAHYEDEIWDQGHKYLEGEIVMLIQFRRKDNNYWVDIESEKTIK